jgi:hypothetical protein
MQTLLLKHLLALLLQQPRDLLSKQLLPDPLSKQLPAYLLQQPLEQWPLEQMGALLSH